MKPDASGKLHTATVNVYPFRTGTQDEPEFLLIRKNSSGKSPQAGIWQVVSGKVDKGEPYWQAAVRELKEETSLAPLSLYEMGAETFYSYYRDCICIHPTFAAKVAEDSSVEISIEHEDWEWLPFDQALIRLPYPTQRESIARLRFNIIDAQPPLPFEIPETVWKVL